MTAMALERTAAALEVDDLHVTLRTRGGLVHAVNGVSLRLPPGRVLALVGESGSGKSMTVRAIMRLLPPGAAVRGEVRLGGRNLLALSERDLGRVRGRDVAIAFQNAGASLNPTRTVGAHLRETFSAHGQGSHWRDAAAEALRRAGLAEGAALFSSYPFELSGGQQQRVALALAIALRPSVLLADEVTTSLDVTTQAVVLDQLRDLAHSHGQAVLLITHDLAVAARWSDDLAVMYGGTVVEEGETGTVLYTPAHPYTAALVACQPRLRGGAIAAVSGRAETLHEPLRCCPYLDRCPRAAADCATSPPPALGGIGGGRVACYHPLSLQP